jgi:hypothetical protein|tara:strand:+ start:839 stop:1033 length:195 start_codon:yes stop_codon:yes gene_type:complete
MYLRDHFESTGKDFRVERVANGFVLSINGYKAEDKWICEEKFVVTAASEVIDLFGQFLMDGRND